ncbi:hypothetical protein AaE_000383, partial [Aphanomyces astaci]
MGVTCGLHDLLAPCMESRDGTTLDLHAFHYEHFLDFIEWTVQNKHVEVSTLSGYRSAIQSVYKDQGVPVPLEYGDDIKEVFSGTKNKDYKHCYANPFKPAICLYVALGVYLSCNNRITPTELFPGANQKDRFGKSLAALIEAPKTGAKKDIGTHSIRKGAATFVSSGSTGGTSIVSVCLRCGWSLGNVMERYFRYEAVGDQIT